MANSGNDSTRQPGSDEVALENGLCLDCGLCCTGVVFSQINLKTSELARANTLPFEIFLRKPEENQYSAVLPCPSHIGGRCTIYAERPSACFKFRCLVLRAVAAGEIDISEARDRVAEALSLARKVREKAKDLGHLADGQALRRVLHQFQTTAAPRTAATGLNTEELEFARMAGRLLMVLDRWFHENDLVANYIEMISHAENAETVDVTSDD